MSSRSRDLETIRNLFSSPLLSPWLLPQAWPLAHQLLHMLGDTRTGSSGATSLWLEFQRKKINIPARCYIKNHKERFGLALLGSHLYHWLIPVIRWVACAKWLLHQNYKTSSCGNGGEREAVHQSKSGGRCCYSKEKGVLGTPKQQLHRKARVGT